MLTCAVDVQVCGYPSSGDRAGPDQVSANRNQERVGHIALWEPPGQPRSAVEAGVVRPCKDCQALLYAGAGLHVADVQASTRLSCRHLPCLLAQPRWPSGRKICLRLPALHAGCTQLSVASASPAG